MPTLLLLMSAPLPVPGQRWVSDNEPELGLGIILRAEFGRVEILFPAASTQRQYALQSAPIRRVAFGEGDRIKLHDGGEVSVVAVEERGGLIIYKTAAREVPEADLSDAISFAKPEERLLAGQVDEPRVFGLRAEALTWRRRIAESPVRGFVGGRVDLIPHQLSIAAEVPSRLLPRVLLADEVGLGKTIEAGLILHRLHATGRAARILILVPEPLVHQWFIELLRRFNLLFSIFDEERCEAIELHHSDANPFLDSQLVLCPVSLLADDPARAGQARTAGWELLIVDEAHHLEWTPEHASPAYAMVESLASETSGLLLLTATPQQLGPEGHFARLRLLDPDRYSDLAHFLEEAGHYERVARAADRLLAGESLTAEDRELFGAHSARVRDDAERLASGDEAARPRLVADLLDSFGTGRVMFRNTRAALSGFPERKAQLIALQASRQADPTIVKVKWLVTLLKQLREQKLLLICRTRALAEQIHALLQSEINVSGALFHEGLTLLQRDRNAAFFSEEEGARILICSEIGSEGRNFQFAHHLVLFDLPPDPELIEQRIGRLDRIGQTATITIHVPYLHGTAEEVLARWVHEGLHAFEENLHGASEIAHAVAAELQLALESTAPASLATLLDRSREERARVGQRLARGYDRLLELSSSKPERAEEIARLIRAADTDLSFEDFFVRLLDHFGVAVEELSARTYLLLPGHLITDAFPALPAEGLSVTFDRARALSRDDLGFLTWDHPLVRGALDLLLGSETGNAAFSVAKSAGDEGLLLEIITVAECVAPPALHADRFLPPTPLRVLVDHAGSDLSADSALAEMPLEKGDVFRLLDRGAVKKKLVPVMLEKAQGIAAERLLVIVEAASRAMNAQLGRELERLEDLREINRDVRPEELAALREQQSALAAAIGSARLRLDAVRLIWRAA